MSILTQLQADLRQAMLAKDNLTRDTLRMALAAIHNRQIELRREPNDSDVLEVLNRQVKQRRESIEAYRAGGREESARSEEAEKKVLQAYLPAQLGEAEVERIVRQVIHDSGVQSASEMGRVMGLVMPQLKGKAEGKLISETVKRLLA